MYMCVCVLFKNEILKMRQSSKRVPSHSNNTSNNIWSLNVIHFLFIIIVTLKKIISWNQMLSSFHFS